MKKEKIDRSSFLKFSARAPFFDNISSDHLNTIASYSDHISAKKDEVLYTAGEKHCGGIFYLMSGKVTLSWLEDGNNLDFIREVYENETFNSSSIFDEETSTNTALISEQSSLLFIPKQPLVNLCDENPIFNEVLHEKTTIEFNREKLFKILSLVYSKEVNQDILREIINSGEWVSLKKNIKLFDAGDPSDSIFFLVRGFLKVFIPLDKNLREVGEIKEGEVIGEMGLLSDEPRSASIYSTRDSILFKISKVQFDNLMSSKPSVLFAISKQIISRFKKNQNIATENEHNFFITLVYTSDKKCDPILNCGIGNSLDKALNKYDSSYFLNKEKIEEMLSVKDINNNLGSKGKYYPLDDLLNRIARDHKYIILETEINNTPWTNWCTSLSDRFLFLLNPNEGIQNSAIIDRMNQIQLKTPDHLLIDRQLIVCHNDKKLFPERTIEFFDALKPISNHYHICVSDENDFSRIARIFANKSIGIAFGGGGARGLAHIGVYNALLDNGVPIDVVCGTSAGSMMAGLVASGFSINEIKNTFVNFANDIEIKWTDYNLPYSSILKDKKLFNAYTRIFGDRNIEDLWLPMFCCAANISTAELEVLNRGKIWRAVRASSSLPGLVVPLVENNSFYVDGGLLNNMPGDILKKVFNSKLISVNVSPEQELIPNFDDFPNQTSLVLRKMLSKNKYENEFGNLDIPTLGNIMVRSIMVGSAKKTKEVADLSEIYLNIPTDGFAMLDYKKIDELIELGYDHTTRNLNDYDLSKTLGIPLD